jgi:hypothetical protein
MPRRAEHHQLHDFDKDRIIDMREAGFLFARFPKEWVVEFRSSYAAGLERTDLEQDVLEALQREDRALRDQFSTSRKRLVGTEWS